MFLLELYQKQQIGADSPKGHKMDRVVDKGRMIVIKRIDPCKKYWSDVRQEIFKRLTKNMEEFGTYYPNIRQEELAYEKVVRLQQAIDLIKQVMKDKGL